MRAALVAAMACAACQRGPQAVVLASTTSIQDSGLADALRPALEGAAGLPVKGVFVGSGEALAMLRRGDADLALVHAPEAEGKFLAQVPGARRREVMSNRFVIVGPQDDPAKVREEVRPFDALAAIARARQTFVSRADRSGTHERELLLWNAAGVAPAGDWYVQAGVGQAETLRIAAQRRAYAITDSSTWAMAGPKAELAVVWHGDAGMRNVYAVIDVPSRGTTAARVADALVGPEAQALIASFGRGDSGEPAFFPASR